MGKRRCAILFLSVGLTILSACSPQPPAANASSSDVAAPSQPAAPVAETSPPVASETPASPSPEAAAQPAVESPAPVEPATEPTPAAAAEPAPAPVAETAAVQTAPPAVEPWSYGQFVKTVEATGRKMSMSEDAFNSIQARKEKAVKSIETYLAGKFGQADPAVLKAFGEVPREYFHYNYQGHFSTASSAYEADAKPWGVGFGSALSDYLGQAYMTQLAEPGPDDVVLEIGTGSGFQSSLLSRIVKEVYSIEIIEPLGNAVGEIVKTLGYSNVHTKVGDGYYGWPEVNGGFDAIIVTCAALHVPQPLLEQLKPGGKLIIPVGPPMRGKQVLYVYTKDQDGKVHSRRDVGIYFIPMTGAMLKDKKKEG